MSEESRKMLTNLAADLSARVLNYSNLTAQHVPKVGQWVYMPDRILYKSAASLISALGRVIKADNRTLYIRFASRKTVLRAAGDVVLCDRNQFDKIVIDLLDLPLHTPNEEHLRPCESVFDIFLPSIDLQVNEETLLDNNVDNDIVMVLPNTDAGSSPPPPNFDAIEVDEEYEEKEEAETIRHSSRPHKPSYKYLARFADN